MDPYNRERSLYGLPVEYELGRATAELVEKRGKQLLSRSKSLLALLLCVDAGENIVGAMNGTFYLGGGQLPLILTTAHIIGWGGAVKYRASFDSEDGVPCLLDLELLKSGAVIPHETAAPPQAHKFSPDLAVFRCKTDRMPALAPPLPPRAPSIGDKTYIMAYTGGASRVLNMSDGIVSAASWNKYTTTAYADHGYSGAPVIDMRGFLLGVVVDGIGASIKQVSFVPATTIHAFLQTGEPQLPGLPAID